MSNKKSIIYTSVDDIRSSMKCNFRYYTLELLEFNLHLEKSNPGYNRITVIKMIERAIRLKKEGKTEF